jgi:hypothetical protein
MKQENETVKLQTENLAQELQVKQQAAKYYAIDF